jgi:phospholipid/cholesterol/gamma-HCH transport system substrate-binding protein
VVRRVLVLAALAAAAAVALVALLGSGSPYEVRLRIANAGQLVKGNVVTVGGLPVGTVRAIDLTADGQALVTVRIDEHRFTPLHEGTRAQIRVSSLSSVANRAVALDLGPTSAPALPDGAVIAATRTSAPVEIDQVISTLDSQTRADLQQLIHGGAGIFAGDRAPAANRTLAALNPAVGQTAGMLDALDRDQEAFRDVVVDTSSVMSALGGQARAVDGLLSGAARLSTQLATRTGSIDRLLRRAPQGVAGLTDVFGAYAQTFGRLRPTARRLSAITPAAATAVRRLEPTLREAGPALRELRPLLGSLTRVLDAAPSLQASGVPALRATAQAVDRTLPIVRGALPYVPDVLHGLVGGFGGETAAAYDANGNYVRIAPQIGADSVLGALSSLGLVKPHGAVSSKNTNRCPGGAAPPAADGSNPFVPDAITCDRSQTP